MDGSEDRGFAERVRDAYRETPTADEDARERVMGALRAGRVPRHTPRGLLGWLVGPVHFELRPVAALAAAAALIVLGVLVGLELQSARPRPGPAAPAGSTEALAPGESARVVRFVLLARGASTVALVGDFNGWDAEATPMRRLRTPGGTGDSWAVSVPVTRGRHLYAFVVDGEHWMADPRAPLAPEDDFGKQNSVIVVGGPSSS